MSETTWARGGGLAYTVCPACGAVTSLGPLPYPSFKPPCKACERVEQHKRDYAALIASIQWGPRGVA